MDTGNQLLKGEPAAMDQHPLHGRVAKLLGAYILTIQIRDNTTAIFAPHWPMYAFSIIYRNS